LIGGGLDCLKRSPTVGKKVTGGGRNGVTSGVRPKMSVERGFKKWHVEGRTGGGGGVCRRWATGRLARGCEVPTEN